MNTRPHSAPCPPASERCPQPSGPHSPRRSWSCGARMAAFTTFVNHHNSKIAAQRGGRPAPGSRLPAPDSRLPAPGSRLPAPGSRLPAPGSRLPAPGSRQILEPNGPHRDPLLPRSPRIPLNGTPVPHYGTHSPQHATERGSHRTPPRQLPRSCTSRPVNPEQIGHVEGLKCKIAEGGRREREGAGGRADGVASSAEALSRNRSSPTRDCGTTSDRKPRRRPGSLRGESVGTVRGMHLRVPGSPIILGAEGAARTPLYRGISAADRRRSGRRR